MSWKITPIYDGLVSDADATAYLAAVQAADGQLLEPGVRIAVNDFIVGCKADGIWPAIKASCILAGARTLSGALVPLVGAAPTSFNFAAGDYNRKTGLSGNGSTKYLNSNRNSNIDPQNNRHLSVYVSSANSSSNNGSYIATASPSSASSLSDIRSVRTLSPNFLRFRLTSGTAVTDYDINNVAASTGFIAANRSSSSAITARQSASTSTSGSNASVAPVSATINVFQRNSDQYSDARLAFYSIGESLDLALLDARVTALINAFAAAIP